MKAEPSENKTVENFREKIVDIRKVLGLTQGQVADAIGISRQSITLYETGKRVPDIVVLSKLADYFHVTSDYLLGREGREKYLETEMKVKRSRCLKMLREEIGKMAEEVTKETE